MQVYLDNAATTPIDQEVLDAMIPFLKNNYGNPSSIHSHGRQVRSAIESARKKIAELINCSTGEIVFTSGGTEADNAILKCAVATHNIKHVISTPIEHHAVLHTLENLVKDGQINLSFVKLDDNGQLDYDHLKTLLQQNPKSLVSIMHANNEIGNIYDIHRIGELCKEYNAFFHSDTVQTVGHYPHDLSTLNIDGITAAAHKFHGPKGAGFMFVRKKSRIDPLIYGGAQERNMRGGTENVYGIIGLAKALEIAYRDMEDHHKYIQGLKTRMIEKLKASIPGVGFNGTSADPRQSLYTVLNVCLPESENNDMILFNLDLKGISASGGSACSSGASKGSHVLQAIKVNPRRGAVRFSFSKFNTEEEIDYAVEVLADLYKQELV
ncbi:MAG: cysteine desulfurase family protein [Candidatus Cyclobacteriaceae bacterium M2_1C_046]